MSGPKITGLLHNCALNCALPILLEGINSLAKLEAQNKLAIVENEPLVKSYDLLKTLFLNYYHISDQLSYQQWSDFLNDSNFSFYAKEIIFAPILRNFMAVNCGTDDISAITKLGFEGHYADLHHNDAYQYLYKYFGIHIHIYEFTGNKYSAVSEDNYSEVPYRVKPIIKNYPFGSAFNLSLYLKNEHYELQPHEDLEEANKKFNNEVENLSPTLKKISNSLNFSLHIGTTEQALSELQWFINKEMNLALSRNKVKNFINNHSSSPNFFSDSSKQENVRTGKQQAINDLIDTYFGPQTQNSSELSGIFGDYLCERRVTFNFKDAFSLCLACLMGCFGYQTESQKRENYLFELRDLLKNSSEEMDVLSAKINEGKQIFSPRSFEGDEYHKSLNFKLTSLRVMLRSGV